MGVKIAQRGNPIFETIQQSLLMRPGGGGTYALNTLCQKKIADEFTQDAINNAYFLVVNINNSGEIIGFAAVMYYADDDDRDVTYLYIELICNAPGHSMGLRSNVNRVGAKAMIEEIERLARNMGCSYVKLSAIDEVVPYYFRLGFNFKSVVGEDGEINNFLRKRSAALVQKLRDGQLDDDKEEQEQAMIKIVQRFYPGYLNEDYQQMLSSVKRNRTGPARDQGIPMIKWLDTSRQITGGKKTKKRKHKSKSKSKYNKIKKTKSRKQRKNKTKRRKSKK
jgi:GNAT superfamily N-acetyltransferase